MKKNKYDIIYSIGSDCACSMYLKDNLLRLTSGPFDWLTNADLETRLNLILNNFEIFLKLENLEFLEKDETMFNDKHCDYYKDTVTNFSFFHDFKKREDLKKTYPKVKEKYDRRIKRFYKLINQKEKVLFVWLSHYNISIDKNIIDKINAINEKFNKNIDFVFILNDGNINTDEIKISEIQNNIKIYSLKTKNYTIDEDPTLGNIKLINKIFKNYSLNISIFKKIKMKRIKFDNILKISKKYKNGDKYHTIDLLWKTIRIRIKAKGNKIENNK